MVARATQSPSEAVSTDESGQTAAPPRAQAYVLDAAVGFLLRQVHQRHTSIFVTIIGDDLTPTQWAALSKLAEVGDTSQNHLGRQTAMDAPTIKGVVDRLSKRGLIETRDDPEHGRRRLVALTAAGHDVVVRQLANAHRITEKTLEPLTQREAERLVELLKKLR